MRKSSISRGKSWCPSGKNQPLRPWDWVTAGCSWAFFFCHKKKVLPLFRIWILTLGRAFRRWNFRSISIWMMCKWCVNEVPGREKWQALLYNQIAKLTMPTLLPVNWGFRVLGGWVWAVGFPIIWLVAVAWLAVVAVAVAVVVVVVSYYSLWNTPVIRGQFRILIGCLIFFFSCSMALLMLFLCIYITWPSCYSRCEPKLWQAVENYKNTVWQKTC